MVAARPREPSDETALYPALCHVSIIADARDDVDAAIRLVLTGYAVVSPLASGGTTPSGRHRALRVSVQIESREALNALDQALRAVPGVRMIL